MARYTVSQVVVGDTADDIPSASNQGIMFIDRSTGHSHISNGETWLDIHGWGDDRGLTTTVEATQNA